VKFNFWRIF